MKAISVSSTVMSAGVLLGLLALQQWSAILPHTGALGTVRHTVSMSRGEDPALALVNGQTAGFYETLLRGSDERDEGRTLLGWLTRNSAAAIVPESENYNHGGFLSYELKPNLDRPLTEEGPMKTNSYGLSDREYSLEKPAHTRRIAVLGDSVTRGWGLPPEARYESLLEARLNAEFSATGPRFEVLNFAASGYRITQLFDLALDKATPFHPDVYLLALTDLGVGESWSDHLSQLAHQGIDLKYDFLRQAVAASGIRKDDEGAAVEAKLRPYRLPVIREILQRLKNHAEQHSARLMVVLVPTAGDSRLTRLRFQGVPETIRGLGITLVDLLDTFDGVSDIETVRSSWCDLHPNREGHRLIAGNLFLKLRTQGNAWSALTADARGLHLAVEAAAQ